MEIVKYGSRLKRLGAYLIDILLISVVVGVIFWNIGFNQVLNDYIANPGDFTIREEFSSWSKSIRNTSFIVYCIYGLLLEASKLQATIGKRIFGIRVIREDGSNLTPINALFRNACKIVSYLPFGLGFLWILFNKRKKGWHDYIAKTIVVADDRK